MDRVDRVDTVGGGQGWREADSMLFADLGEVFTPRREEIAAAVCELIPSEAEEAFTAVDLGVGEGWLSAAILRQHARARVLGLDRSPAMRRSAEEALAPYGERFRAADFRLEARDWLTDLPTPVRVFVSSLAVHHLDAQGKQRLFSDVYQQLEPGGALLLLLVDVVEPVSETQRRHYAQAWDRVVRRQSREMLHDQAGYQRFVELEWNLYDHPDPEVDKPSPLPDQLDWLARAGFAGVDVFWLVAGHAVYGGYKAPNAHVDADPQR